MTAIVRRPTQLAQPEQLDRPGISRSWVTGTPTEVAAIVGFLQQSGTLVSASVPRQVSPTDFRLRLMVRVRDVPAESRVIRHQPVRARRWVKPVVIGGTTVTVLAGLILGGYVAAQQFGASGTGLAVGFPVVVVVLVLMARAGARKGVCVGLHCSGCGHR